MTGTTPIQDRLRSFSQVRALVFGQYGEASADVHHLLAEAATRMARSEWRRWGARSMAEARAFFIASLRRQLGVCVVREFARHRLDRVAYIGVPRAALERRQRSGGSGQLGTGGLRGMRDDMAPVPSDFHVHQAWGRPERPDA